MSPFDVGVPVLGGLLAIGELWLFLGRRPRSAPQRSRGMRAQEIRVLVRGAFHPDVMTVEVGRPVRILFYREETSERSSRVVFDQPSIEQVLPPFQTTSVEFLPSEAGDYHFRCGDNMTGCIAAQTGTDAARRNLGRGHKKHG